MLVLPIASQAACVRADLTGVWRLYSEALSSFRSMRCTILMPPSGSAILSSSRCGTASDGVVYNASGTLTLYTNCNAIGTLRLGTGTIYKVDAWLDRSKNVIVGNFWVSDNAPGGGYNSTISGVKQ